MTASIRRRAAFLAAATLVGLTVPSTASTADRPVTARSTTTGTRSTDEVIDDPDLVRLLRRADRFSLDRAERPGTEFASSTPTGVEVLGRDTDRLARALQQLGGTVSGVVDGLVVQGEIAVHRLDELARVPGVDDLRSPRRVGRRDSTGTGPTVGEEVAVTGAAAWQAAGLTGAGVRVGVIDYFDPANWDTAELGPLPTTANGRLFCRDTSTGTRDCTSSGQISAAGRDTHGNAVVEIVKDMAPDAVVHVATVGTLADLDAAIDWFADAGVTIITRSLGAAFDGPGDGTGPLDEVVARAVSRGITWFNSAGNDGLDSYLRRTVPTSTPVGGYVDFRDGRPLTGAPAGPDTWLRLDGRCIWLDGIRWATDWSLPVSARTAYSVEFWEPRLDPSTMPGGDHWNPTTSQVVPLDVGGTGSGGHVLTADPEVGTLIGSDLYTCPRNAYGPSGGVVFIRIRVGSRVGDTADVIEVATGPSTYVESEYSDAAGSAAKPVVDSRHPAVVAVGAVDPPEGDRIAGYSSRGPTNDGRVKPDLAAPSGVRSTSYLGATFSGTSAASPAAAGAAALLAGAGLAAPGPGLAALVRHLATDIGRRGDDNSSGSGLLTLPPPPAPAAPPTPGAYVPLTTPTRILDTRSSTAVGPTSLRGPHRAGAILDIDVVDGVLVPGSGVAAVAVNITSVDPTTTGYLQAYPTLVGATGATSTLNVVAGSGARPNFAIVPLGLDGRISIFAHAGGHVVVDLVGYVTAEETARASGRIVTLSTPERWLDTGPDRLGAGRTRAVARPTTSAVPATGVAALVVNLTGTNAGSRGHLELLPRGLDPSSLDTSTVNMSPGSASANQAIVRVGRQGQVTVTTSTAARVVVDVVGYVTDGSAPVATKGLYVPIVPTRVVDTRTPRPIPFSDDELRLLDVDADSVPVGGVSGVLLNLTVTGTPRNGWLRVFFGPTEPTTSNLNAVAGRSVANAAFVRTLSGTVKARTLMSGHLVVDLHGYLLS